VTHYKENKPKLWALRLFEKSLLWRIFRSGREMRGGWRKLHDLELNISPSSQT
jgi:hypothetical protein